MAPRPFSCTPPPCACSSTASAAATSRLARAALISALGAARARSASARRTLRAMHLGCRAPLGPAAGALFGFPLGLLIVMSSACAAAAVAFSLGRLFRPRLRRWLEKRDALQRNFAFVDRTLADAGFRAMLLLRLIPAPPIVNYLYGCTRVGFPAYMCGTAMGTARDGGGRLLGRRRAQRPARRRRAARRHRRRHSRADRAGPSSPTWRVACSRPSGRSRRGRGQARRGRGGAVRRRRVLTGRRIDDAPTASQSALSG